MKKREPKPKKVRVQPVKNISFDPRFPQSGALLVDKPEGISSTDVIYKIKKSLSKGLRLPWGFKIGHSGTLDPFATGLMVVFYGEATKLANSYTRSQKSYSAQMVLGQKTDTADYTGAVTSTAPVPAFSRGDWQNLASRYVERDYFQTPPMYSAKKIDGMALHHIARQGREIERDAILKKIYSFDIKSITPTQVLTEAESLAPIIEFDIACESGTYVRTIAEDLAQDAGTVAHLKSLKRTASSDFKVIDAHPLDEVTALLGSDADPREFKFLRSIEQVGLHLPSLSITHEDELSLSFGSAIRARDLIQTFQRQNPTAIYGLLRSQDGFPVILIHDFKLQRTLLRPANK